MFTLRVDDEIELQLLEKHHKEELYQLLIKTVIIYENGSLG